MPKVPQVENIHYQQLHEIVAERLRAAILNGELKPGEFIRQQRIAEEFGVSQIPVREALKDLASESLVEHIPYRGVRVVEYTLEDLRDLFDLRSYLEGRAAAAAAERISTEELDRLGDLIEEMNLALTSDQIAVYRDLNQKFHEIIYLSSQRKYLIQNLDKMWLSFPIMIVGSFPQSGDKLYQGRDLRDHQEHQQILKALRNRDAENAEQLIKDHIGFAGNELILTLQKSR